jgi:hypothetical protein
MLQLQESANRLSEGKTTEERTAAFVLIGLSGGIAAGLVPFTKEHGRSGWEDVLGETSH